MKKFLMFVSVLAVAGAASTASAMDRSGKIGLGIQESFTTGFSTNSFGDWSLKYGVASNMTGQFLVGFDYGNKAINDAINFGARFLYDVVEKENSDFYLGLGIGWNNDKSAGARILRFQVPLGYEFSFSGLPEVGFSVEAGVVYDYAKDAKASRFASVGGNVGGNLGLGVHYYF
ncbi:MAG TPA: hypothetical protein VI895_12895 [Bdellovibrionota bacterium]|nr:hypothetical protein [Bdellovibrionota bacterium]